ncbi:DUF1499 domain-containing protein [Methylocella sp. CPCC 101449]|jgi:uncharacterized protein (DUF1499 family)|uniref:DUF1499 domain-containing protein n=1 Tax=Methylocella sp. CPCC 101449 TaxID=2987531 RepID=UPI002891EA85|nr:DUF1499 domain-containing protein [Methylocella sp. CPCC 101449]MDT2024172.1 DUF1499 domain-containing protein [Methylocella sp. CPCC 101449]HEV2571318.1 DUF1499 domain-containing protein [Beijerinckiaceae bacterium]
MRRLILEEPISASAIWARRLAVFAIALAAIAVILVRTRAADATAGLSVLGAAIFLACTALLFAGAAAVTIWRLGVRGVGIAVSAVFLSLIVLAYPGYLAVQAVRLPVIKDISTDINDPPAFARSARALRGRNGFIPPEVPPEQRLAQRRAYPNVQPINIDLEPEEVYQLVLRAAAALGWQVVDQIPPGGRAGIGRIDAVDRSIIMGLPDDITVRIRPLAAQTRIDIRSASRAGRHDFGANANRIQRFSQEMQTQLDAR